MSSAKKSHGVEIGAAKGAVAEFETWLDQRSISVENETSVL